MTVNDYISINAIDGASVAAVAPTIAEEIDKHLKGAGGVGLM